MEPANYHKVSLSLQKQARFFRLLTFCLAIGIMSMGVVMLIQLDRQQRIVIVPPEIRTSFWIEDETVSRNYFLEWGYYIIGLLLNVTPQSIDYQSEVLMRHVAPGYKEQINNRLEVAAERLRKEDLTTFFAVSTVDIKPEQGKVAFTGTLTSYVQGRRISERSTAFAATFQVIRGQLALVNFVETEPNNVFVAKYQ